MTRKTGLKKNGDPYGGWVCGVVAMVTSVMQFGIDHDTSNAQRCLQV
jgi:hypothetical protein